jgi:hypothetical protein
MALGFCVVFTPQHKRVPPLVRPVSSRYWYLSYHYNCQYNGLQFVAKKLMIKGKPRKLVQLTLITGVEMATDVNIVRI